MAYFSCKQITRSYQQQPVVEDITLALERGQCACLLGPSGVGKSTLMGVLSGIDQPDTGRVLLNGEDITGQPGRVSYMLQKDLLLYYKTILDNVSLPLQLNGIPKAQARQQALDLFEVFGLSGCAHQYPHQLSGGMRQRAALLRTWLVGNDVLLMDEPFSALDAMTKHQLHAWFLEVSVQLHMTTLLITHDIDEALSLADTIYIMNGVPGRIVQTFPVNAPHPRTTDFTISDHFIQQKREILAAIE